jgi:hypothetical protein
MTDILPAAPQNGPPHPPENRGRANRQERHWLDNLAVLAASAAAIGAAGAAGVSAWQACIARDTEQRQIRAYISLQSIRLEKRNDETFDIIPEWENTGNSQTVNMTTFVNRLFLNVDMPSNLMYADMDGVRKAPITLGPKSKSGISFDQVSKTCLDQFNRRDEMSHFFLWGHATYHDVLTDEEHITRFCWDAYQVIFSADGKSARLSYALCNEGNCADRECPTPEKQKFAMVLPTCKPPPSAIVPPPSPPTQPEGK